MANEKSFEVLSSRIDAVEGKLDSILKSLKSASETRINNAKIIDNNFEMLNSKIEALDKKIKTLHTDTNQNFEEVKFELVKIQKTTDYDSLYDNLRIVNDKD